TWLDGLDLPQPYAGKVASLRQLNAELTGEITLLEQVIGDLLAGHEGYRAIQALPGIGPVLGAVIVAEIGDIRRFRRPEQLCSWAGLTPRHRESDTKVSRGHVTKQGSRMLRWAVCEAIQRQPADTRPRQVKDGIIARRGAEAKNTAKGCRRPAGGPAASRRWGRHNRITRTQPRRDPSPPPRLSARGHPRQGRLRRRPAGRADARSLTRGLPRARTGSSAGKGTHG